MQWLSKECQHPPYAHYNGEGPRPKGNSPKEKSATLLMWVCLVNTNEHKTAMENITMENIWWTAESDTVFKRIKTACNFIYRTIFMLYLFSVIYIFFSFGFSGVTAGWEPCANWLNANVQERQYIYIYIYIYIFNRQQISFRAEKYYLPLPNWK